MTLIQAKAPQVAGEHVDFENVTSAKLPAVAGGLLIALLAVLRLLAGRRRAGAPETR